MPARAVKKALRRLGVGMLGFALLLLLFMVGALIWLRFSLPESSGTRALPGLSAPAALTRDANGVPHIRAATAEDVYFGLGFAHAQDRMWQMEMMRRLVQGRLSEVFGRRTRESDILFRSLGLSQRAEIALAALAPDSRAALAAYARGVNAYLGSHRGPYAPEFVIFRHAPEPWRPADSLMVLDLMTVMLASNAFAELGHARLLDQLGPERFRAFVTPELDGPPFALPPIAGGTAKGTPARPPFGAPGGASNNWVVSGALSRSGKPLLANDPHLGLSAPGLWYLAHLAFPDGNVVGATLPGFPAVILGRNDRIAWGLTNTGADTQDVFVEKLHPSDPSLYLTPDGYRPFETRTETLKLRGDEPVTLTLRRTRHGPVLPEAVDAGVAPPGHVLALAWTIYERPNTTGEAILRATRAHDWESFLAALDRYRAPIQSIVYADRAGHIGFVVPGLVPLRKPENETAGFLPVPGWDARFDWAGHVPPEAMPRRLDPPEGMLYSANNRIVAEDFPFYLTREWDPPYRAGRIAALLRDLAPHSRASFRQMQADVVSPVARELLPLLLAATPKDGPSREALALLRSWDGRMAAARPEPLIFAAWMRAIGRLVYADETGPLFPQLWRHRPRFLLAVLTGADGQDRWCDDITTGARETCPDLVARALAEALAELRARQSERMEHWRWGEAHQALHLHRTLGEVPVLGRLFNIVRPSDGGAFTLDRGLYMLTGARPYANIHASTLRAIYDLADLDRSLFMTTTGQSGNVLSPFYRNFARAWGANHYAEISTEPAAYCRAGCERLDLMPVR